MLYLIVPPIIIVITLTLLLWYLSKKASDPEVSERVLEMGELPRKAHFQKAQEWRLRFLEKFAQRSKNTSLRMHNALHTWLQSIRASRKQVEEAKQRVEEYQGQDDEVVYLHEEQEQTPTPVEPPVMVQKEENAFAIPLMRRRKREEEASPEPRAHAKIFPAKREVEERPMVSEKVALPERRVGRGKAPEEDLIGRIATNPKDFEAYEALGDFYMENGNIKDAKECYRQVLKLSPVQRMVKIKIRRLEKLLGQKGN